MVGVNFPSFGKTLLFFKIQFDCEAPSMSDSILPRSNLLDLNSLVQNQSLGFIYCDWIPVTK